MSSTASSATGAGSSTSPAERLPRGDGQRLQLTRRVLLASTAAVPVLVSLPALAASPAAAASVDRGEPFDDGTYFDDGYGWVD